MWNLRVYTRTRVRVFRLFVRVYVRMYARTCLMEAEKKKQKIAIFNIFTFVIRQIYENWKRVSNFSSFILFLDQQIW